MKLFSRPWDNRESFYPEAVNDLFFFLLPRLQADCGINLQKLTHSTKQWPKHESSLFFYEENTLQQASSIFTFHDEPYLEILLKFCWSSSLIAIHTGRLYEWLSPDAVPGTLFWGANLGFTIKVERYHRLVHGAPRMFLPQSLPDHRKWNFSNLVSGIQMFFILRSYIWKVYSSKENKGEWQFK